MARFRGDVLARAREARGYNRPELAALLGVASPQRVVNWEVGREEPRARFVSQLASLLAVPALEFYGVTVETADMATLRMARGLTAPELAARVGLALTTYSRLERGIPTRVHKATLEKLAQVLDVRPARVRELVTSV